MHEPKISVMVTAHGVTDESGKIRTSLHTFEFDSEEKLDAWLATAPVRQEKNGGPVDIHVEIPGNRRARN